MGNKKVFKCDLCLCPNCINYDNCVYCLFCTDAVKEEDDGEVCDDYINKDKIFINGYVLK